MSIPSLERLTGFLVLVTTFALAPEVAAGNVLRVGATRAHKTIQSAVDASSTGDLVLVDPGTYAGFLIRRKGVAVVAASTPFVVTTSATAPAIFVRDVAYPNQVSIIGARVDYRSRVQPAVHLLDNSGSVRFSRLDVDLAADVCSAAQQAAVIVHNSKTFWFIDSRVFTATARKGSTANPAGANDGLSALLVSDSDGVVQNSQLRGYDACIAYSGDGMRMTGNTSIWLLADFVQPPQGSVLQGGTGGRFGGNAMHYLGPLAGLGRFNACGKNGLVGGKGSTQDGGFFAHNNDGGSPQPGLTRLPASCLDLAVAQTSVDSPVVSLGGSLQLRLFTLFSRSYALAVSTNTDYSRSLLGLGLEGRGLVDVFAPGAIIFNTGTTAASRVTVLNRSVPNLAVLSGLQLTFQSLVGPVNGVGTALSLPSLVVITR